MLHASRLRVNLRAAVTARFSPGFAGARGLNHLVARAVTLGEKLFAEAKGEIVEHLGLAVGVERAVVAGLLKEFFRGLGHIGRIGRIRPVLFPSRISG